jgi:hypothetical protein
MVSNSLKDQNEHRLSDVTNKDATHPMSYNATASSQSIHPHATSQVADDFARVFNTAIIATRAGSAARDFSGQLLEQIETPAFRAILSAVRSHAKNQGISDRQAAEQVIQAFRRVDQLWTDYLIQEGVDRLRGGST